ncbi:MAG: hypothetical protein ACLUDU_09735 [Butyricimonas faecihominis]
MKYTIEEVLNEKQAKEFLLLPVSLYKNDENWVRPLDNDITKVFDPAKNPFFKHGDVPLVVTGRKRLLCWTGGFFHWQKFLSFGFVFGRGNGFLRVY